MKRRSVSSFALAILVLFCVPQFAMAAGPKARQATCYVLVEEGDSAEANSLFLQKMGLNPESLSFVAPTRFSFAKGFSYTRVGGGFSYEGGEPILVAQKGKLALYSVVVKFWVDSLPRASKTVSVDVTMADLAGTSDMVQPATKAIELAAAKAKMKSGVAWIIDMKMDKKNAIHVKVGLAK